MIWQEENESSYRCNLLQNPIISLLSFDLNNKKRWQRCWDKIFYKWCQLPSTLSGALLISCSHCSRKLERESGIYTDFLVLFLNLRKLKRMGKATRWLRGLLGMKKGKDNMADASNFSERKERNRWSFAKSEKDSGGLREIPAVDAAWLRSLIAHSDKEQNKHAIAVAAATAVAADAAVAAAQAAVAVVRLTSQGRGGGGREILAAIKIQTVFRGFLARKALRALRGLVKLQALVRGYLVRKRAAATLHSMEALIRAQVLVQARRARRIINKLQPEPRPRKSTERFEERSEFRSKRFDPSLNALDESPKIVEIDTCRPESRSRRMSNDDHYYRALSSPLPCKKYVVDHHYLQDFDWGFIPEECKSVTAQNTPRFGCSGRAMIVPEECKSSTAHNTPRFGCSGPATPAKSVCGLGPYSNCPNYMINTQSFRAKLRSQSAPKQRPELGPKRRMSLNEIVASRTSFSGVRTQGSCIKVEEDFEF